ncbi:MAG: GNAT family N-acetyltransferase [Oscillospiraceae bacterium]|nr:GNAT family N-acetyltransferase [Oscillospiraceae bacterium]
MIILKESNKNKWDSIVEKFKNNDIYFKSCYSLLCSLCGDGDPMLFYYEEKEAKICLVALKKDISKCRKFENLIENNKFYDLSTPYGYSGFLVENQRKSYKFLDNFFDKFTTYCINNNIVSLFIRFHPTLQNQCGFEKFCKIIKLKKTVYIDTENQEKIVKNISSKCRNTIRKAQKLGVKIKIDKGEDFDKFIEIYLETMNKNDANKYYYFNNEYFEYMTKNMSENLAFFYANYKNKTIASSIILYCKNHAHYHLSGTKSEYRNFSANDLILFESAVWCSKNSIKNFHLGGGIDGEDNLFSFKKKFNKDGIIDFYIGKIIFDKEKFEYLINLRIENDKNFDQNTNTIITYRG